MQQLLLYPDVYLGIFAGVIAIALFAYLGIVATVMLVNTVRGQQLLRDHLGKRLAGTRMWSMLEHRQVSPLHYIDQTSIPELRAQLRNCEHCEKQALCDETLGYVGTRRRNYGFCPNRHAIDKIVPHGMRVH